MRNVCLITNDVETTSINGTLHDEIGIKVWKEAMPALLSLYDRYNVKATFFFVADFAQKFPEIVKMIIPFGHEVACHGYTHDYRESFENLSLEMQIEHLIKAKNILERISGQEVKSFRAPALRVNSYTPQALKSAGIKIDSSIAPQRLDMFMSLGSKSKLNWLTAPRSPYEVSEEKLSRKGKFGLWEIPISGIGLPYIGTLMRLSPAITRLVRYGVFVESILFKRPVNFLIHPSEFVAENETQTKATRRQNNYLLHLLSDVLRVKLKKKNLGPVALTLLEDELKFWHQKDFQFMTISDYCFEQCK